MLTYVHVSCFTVCSHKNDLFPGQLNLSGFLKGEFCLLMLIKICLLSGSVSFTEGSHTVTCENILSVHSAWSISHVYIHHTGYVCEIKTSALAHGWGIPSHCVPKLPPGRQ